VDVWTGRGLTRFAVLFIIDLSTRRINIAGIAPEPDAPWMSQMSRNLTDPGDVFLTGKRFLIHDRDPRFTLAFRETLAAADVQVVGLPPRSPNLNAYAERFVRTVKELCLDRMILVGEASLRRALCEFAAHYHHERNHQGLGNRLIVPLAEPPNRDGLKGTEIRFGSCRTQIFMEQPAKTIAAFHDHCWRGSESISRRSAVRRREVQAAVRQKTIVMIDENGQHALEMPRAEYQ
jgi:hypothetical protein